MSSVAEPVQLTKADIAFVDVPEEPRSSDAGDDTEAPALTRLQRHYKNFIESMQHQMSLVRPWHQFFDQSSFSFPVGVRDIAGRVHYNTNYYYHNYIVLAFIGATVVMFLNPLFAVCAGVTMAMWWYIGTKRLEAAETNSNHFMLGNTEVTFKQAYLCLFIFAILSFFATNGSSVLFWILASSLGVVLLHASLCRLVEENEPFTIV